MGNSVWGRMLQNVEAARLFLMQRVLGVGSTKRDYDELLDYPKGDIDVIEYKQAYKRGDIAKRIVDLWPKECWKVTPEVYEDENPQVETPFERSWKTVVEKTHLLHFLQRIDRLSGIGRFGVLFLGFSDTKGMDQPVPGINEKGEPVSGTKVELLYVRALDESFVQIAEFETDAANPRFGQAKYYNITFWNSDSQLEGKSSRVHWSRVIHVADNREESEVFGSPRMEVCWNRLIDLKKTAGGSAEMFWQAALPGIAFELDPEMADELSFGEEEQKKTKQQLQDYVNNLSRFLIGIGGQYKTVGGQLVDPTPHVEIQLLLIAIALDVPKRVLEGSEEGKQAADQDQQRWSSRVGSRQQEYLTPFLILELVNRLLTVKVLEPLAEGHLPTVYWPDLFTPGEQEKAETAETTTNAVAKYASSPGAQLVLPLQYFYSEVLGWPTDKVEQIIKEAMAAIEESEAAVEEDADAFDDNQDDEGDGSSGNDDLSQGDDDE